MLLFNRCFGIGVSLQPLLWLESVFSSVFASTGTGNQSTLAIEGFVAVLGRRGLDFCFRQPNGWSSVKRLP